MWERMLERVVGLIKPSFSSPTLQHGQLPVVRSTSTVTIKMTVYNIFATVVLATGIFSLTAARGHSLSRPEFAPAELDAASRSPDFYVPILDPETYVHLSREQCGERNGASVYDEVEASLKNFRINVESLVAPLRRKTELALAHPRDRLPSVMRKYCRKVPTLQKYIKHVTHAINACLDREEVQRVVSGRLFVNALLNYICEDGGSGFATFVADGGMECLALKKQELLNCANRNFGRYLSGAVFVGDGVSEVKGFEMLFALDTKRCADVRAFQSCMTEALDDCEEPTTAKALNDLIDDLVIKLTSCEASRSEVLAAIPEIAFHDAELYRRSNQYVVESCFWTPIVTHSVLSSCGSVVEGHLSTTAQEVPSEDQYFESFMRKKCEKIGRGPMAFAAIEESLGKIGQGYEMLELGGLLYAIEHAAFESNSTFDLDSILASYCRKVPIANEIVKFFTDTFKLCLEPDEEGMDMLHNVTSSLLEAACYNEGNAIAAFVAGDGPECMESKREELKVCTYQIFGRYFEAEGWMQRATPETPFIVDYKDCEDMEKLRTCFGEALTECDDETTSHMMNSVFDVIHDGMSCEELREGMRIMAMSDTELKYESMKHQLLESCERNAEPAAHEAVKDVLRKIEAGAQLVIMHIDQLEVVMRTFQAHGGSLPDIEKYCRKIPALKKFVKHARDSVEVCLPQDAQKDADFQIDVLFSTIDFVCEDDGARVVKFLISDAMNCAWYTRSAWQGCFPSRYRADSGLVQLRKDLDAKDCTIVKQVQHCVVGTLNECHDPTAAQTVDDWINSFMDGIACHNSSRDTN